MHKWQKPNKTTVVLCNRCSSKEYKILDIREQWKKKDMDQEYSCESCGVKNFISNSSID